MGALALHTGAPTVQWGDNTSCISVVEAKIVTPIVKHIDIPVFFYNSDLTMVSFFQNMRSLVSFRQICAPKHVQVQESAGVLNGLLDSDFIQLVCLSVCRSGLQVPIAYSLLGGGVPIPEQRLCWTLDSVPY